MQKCPLCDSQNIRISYSKKIRDYFFKWFLHSVPFRCRKCRLRFYRREPQQSTEYIRDAAAVRQLTDGLRHRRPSLY
jgi:hypothetical protein